MKKVSVFGVFPTQIGVVGYGPYATREEAEKVCASLAHVKFDDPWAYYEVVEDEVKISASGENAVIQMGKETCEFLPNGMYQDNVSQYFLDAVLLIPELGFTQLQRV